MNLNHVAVDAFRRFKQASELRAASPRDAEAYQASLRGTAWRHALYVAMAAAGLGGAARGATGLFNLTRRRFDESPPARGMTAVPYPVVRDEDEEPAKTASNQVEVSGLPQYYPMLVGAGMLGGAGGWRLMDALLDRRRIKDRQEEVDAAKRDFEQALLRSYDRPRHELKLAGDGAAEHLSAQLDQLFSSLLPEPKTAQIKQALGDTMGSALGAYLGLWALPTASLAAYLSYRRAKSHSRQVVLAKAQKQRERQQFEMRPDGVMALPVPVGADQTT